MRTLICLFVLFFSTRGLTQQNDTTRLYLDHTLSFSKKNKAAYYAIVVKEHDHWMLYAVYPNNEPLLKIYFKDPEYLIKDGPFVLYHPQKKKAFEGYFIANQLHSGWQTWYANGHRRDSGAVKENGMNGLWKHWNDSGQLEQQVTYIPQQKYPPAQNAGTGLLTYRPLSGSLHGPSQSWYGNGQTESIGQYKNDTLDGEWHWFREDGKRATEETYTKGKLTKLKCYDEKGVFTGEVCSIITPPVLIHPFLSAQDYVIDQLHRSKNKDIEEGDMEVLFVVTKEGKIKNLTIINSPGKAFSDEVAKIFAAMPAWSPAITHNRRMDFELTMEIPFYR